MLHKRLIWFALFALLLGAVTVATAAAPTLDAPGVASLPDGPVVVHPNTGVRGTGPAFSLDAWKEAPAEAEYGDVISYTVTLSTSNLLTGMSMTDTLPAGVTYAGNLSWTHGLAWHDGTANAVFWEYAGQGAGTPPAGAVPAYVSQVGPDVSRSSEVDGGTAVLDNVPVGAMGPRTPEAYAWAVRNAPPTIASRLAGVVDGAGNFYLIGGESSASTYYGQVQRYDPVAGTWDNTLAAMPIPVANICAAILGDDIYVPGGFDGTYHATLQVYHIGSDTWETIASDPLPAPRGAPACAAYQGKLYVIGGRSGATYTNTTWVYDPAAPAGSRWTTSLANAPHTGAYGAALAVGDLIFYAGMYEYAVDLPHVYAYDPLANTWTTYPNLATPRAAPGMWAIGDLLLVGGGGWSSYLTSVEQYDTTQGPSGTWSTFEASLVQGRRTFGYATDVQHGRLFAGNGWANAYLAELEQLDFGLVPAEVRIAFDVEVTGHCGDVIVNRAVAGIPAFSQTFSATTAVSGEAALSWAPAELQASVCGGTIVTRTLSVCNQGDCPLEWALSEPAPGLSWLSASPVSGTVPRAECQDVTVAFDATEFDTGSYQGDLVVTSNDPNSPAITVTAVLTVPTPVSGVALSWSPPQPVPGAPVQFLASVGGGTPPFTHTWDLGDGTGGSGVTVTHAYVVTGTYVVELTVSNACTTVTITDTLTVADMVTVYLPTVFRNYP